MPDFASPLFLLLTLAVPLVAWAWLRGRQDALRYPSTTLAAVPPGGRAWWARWGAVGMRAAALLALVVALAGPRWPDLHTRLPTEGIAIAMLLDVSGSMAEADFPWDGKAITRLDAVKQAFHLFVAGGEGPDGEQLDGRPDDQIALVTFATRPESACPLTLSHSVLLHMLDAEQPRTLPTESQTNIGDAIAWGLHRLESAGPRRKVLILLSDGDHNVPPPALKPRQAAQLAANLHVPIYTIDASGETVAGGGMLSRSDLVSPENPVHNGRDSMAPGRSPPPTPRPLATNESTDSAADRLDGERTLQAVAQITGGRSFRAHDAKTLLAVCREIDRLERQVIESFQYRRYYEAYPWCGLASFVFLVGVYALEMTLWQRVP
jgi:Ca-activated chloride channel family protein